MLCTFTGDGKDFFVPVERINQSHLICWLVKFLYCFLQLNKLMWFNSYWDGYCYLTCRRSIRTINLFSFFVMCYLTSVFYSSVASLCAVGLKGKLCSCQAWGLWSGNTAGRVWFSSRRYLKNTIMHSCMLYRKMCIFTEKIRHLVKGCKILFINLSDCCINFKLAY